MFVKADMVYSVTSPDTLQRALCQEMFFFVFVGCRV